MSTRSTITLTGPFHLYREVMSGEICLEWVPEIDLYDGKTRPTNEKYGTPVFTRDELRQIHHEIGEFLSTNRNAFQVETDPLIPPGEIHLRSEGKTVGKIVNVAQDDNQKDGKNG